jgi:hypothetical protein
MPDAVVGQRRVVGLVQCGGMGEQPPHEHHHRWQANQFTDGEFEGFQTKLRLEHVPCLSDGEAESVRFAGPLHHQRPPSSQDRIGLQRLEQPIGPAAKRCEAVGIHDAALFPRHLRCGKVERDLFEMGLARRAHRYAHARGHAAVGIDDEVDRGAAQSPGVGIDCKVLQPYARVKEFRADDRPSPSAARSSRPRRWAGQRHDSWRCIRWRR